MSSLDLRLEFDDLHQAAARIFDLVRRMGFDVIRCLVETRGGDGYRMVLSLNDSLDDPARLLTLVHRLGQMAAIDLVDSGQAGRRFAARRPRPRTGLSILGAETSPT